jgi:hypothetical protein
MADKAKKRSDEEAEADVLDHFHAAFDDTIKSVTLRHRGKVVKRIGKGD